MPEKENKKEKKEKFEISEVATQTTPVIRDSESGDMYNLHESLCKMMNDIEEMKRKLS